MKVKEELLHCPGCGLQTCSYVDHIWPDNYYTCENCEFIFSTEANNVTEETHETDDQLELLTA